MVTQQEIPIVSTVGKPKDKILAEKLAALKTQIGELTPELKPANWIDLYQNNSAENFETVCRVLSTYENELNSEQSKTDMLYAGYLRKRYAHVWNILSKYAQNDQFRDTIKQLWQKAIQKQDAACCLELLHTDISNTYVTARDLVQLKNKSWEFIEKNPDISLFDSFCYSLISSNRVTNYILGNAEDIKRLETLMKRIDTINVAGERAIDVAHYSCGIMRYYTDRTYGTSSRFLRPLTFEELNELGHLNYLSEDELARHEKEKNDAKTALETKWNKAAELVTTEKGRLEIINAIGSTNLIQKSSFRNPTASPPP
jgi:hypothetical protein